MTQRRGRCAAVIKKWLSVWVKVKKDGFGIKQQTADSEEGTVGEEGYVDRHASRGSARDDLFSKFSPHLPFFTKGWSIKVEGKKIPLFAALIRVAGRPGREGIRHGCAP